VGAAFNLKNILPRNEFIEIQNLEHKYEAIKTQLNRKVNGAQSSIKKKLITLKELEVEPNTSLNNLKKPPMILNP
jgi:hypothetical protein